MGVWFQKHSCCHKCSTLKNTCCFSEHFSLYFDVNHMKWDVSRPSYVTFHGGWLAWMGILRWGDAHNFRSDFTPLLACPINVVGMPISIFCACLFMFFCKNFHHVWPLFFLKDALPHPIWFNQFSLFRRNSAHCNLYSVQSHDLSLSVHPALYTSMSHGAQVAQPRFFYNQKVSLRILSRGN